MKKVRVSSFPKQQQQTNFGATADEICIDARPRHAVRAPSNKRRSIDGSLLRSDSFETLCGLHIHFLKPKPTKVYRILPGEVISQQN